MLVQVGYIDNALKLLLRTHLYAFEFIIQVKIFNPDALFFLMVDDLRHAF